MNPDKYNFDKIIVGSNNLQIPASKAHLIAASGYFCHMFVSGAFLESRNKYITVVGLSEHALEVLITFAHTGYITIEHFTIGQVYSGPDYLQMDEVKGFCDLFLNFCMDVENVLYTQSMSVKFHSTVLENVANDIIKQNFIEVSPTSSFTFLRRMRLKFFMRLQPQQ